MRAPWPPRHLQNGGQLGPSKNQFLRPKVASFLGRSWRLLGANDHFLGLLVGRPTPTLLSASSLENLGTRGARYEERENVGRVRSAVGRNVNDLEVLGKLRTPFGPTPSGRDGQRQEARSQKPEAGGRKPEAGSRKPESRKARSRKPEAGSRNAEARNK